MVPPSPRHYFCSRKLLLTVARADPRRDVQPAVAYVIMYRHLSYDRAGSQSDVIDADAALTADRRAPGVLEARDRNRPRGANKWFVEIEITSVKALAPRLGLQYCM